MKKLFIVILLSVFLFGCAPVVNSNGEHINTNSEKVYSMDDYIYRRIDREAGVVCYSTVNGLSCLPISETNLK